MQEEANLAIDKVDVPREPGFNLTHKHTGTGTLEIWGALMPGWLGRLTTGLADIGISILQGEAHKVTPSIWMATFTLQSPASGKDLNSVDYLKLATKRVVFADAPELTLTEYRLRPDPADLNAVYVELSGRDQPRFLSGILKQFSLFSLFPTKLLIDTQKGLVFDRFWIKGIGATKPTDEALMSIRRCLDGMIGN